MIKIPLQPSPSRFDIDIDKQLYTFKTEYNVRSQVWTLGIYQYTTPLIIGLPMTLGNILTPSEDLPLNLFMVDLSRQDEEATADDLGDRVIMCHMSPEEVEAWPFST